MKTLNRRQALRLTLGMAGGALIATSALADGHAKQHTVEIKGFAFSPAKLEINAGDTVVFVNKDGAPHTATGNSGGFDTGRLQRGAQGAVTFKTAGSFGYFCEVHPMMKGEIVVK